MQKLKTRKLFFNKWPYKVSCRLRKVNYIVRLGIPRTLNWLDGDTTDEFIWKDANKKELREFIHKFSQFVDADLQVRAETSTFNIFLKDKTLLDNIVKSLGKWVYSVTEPGSEEELDFLMNNGPKKIICDDFPKGKYHYKIYLKGKMDLNSRENFYKWTLRYDQKFDVAGSTKKWLIGKSPYVQDPFIYVEDQQLLSLAGMYLGNNIRRVEEFIPRTKINTSCPI